MHELPPEKTVGDLKSLGNALGALVANLNAGLVSESRARTPVAEEVLTLGGLRERVAAEARPLSDGEDVPEVAWDPATRFAGVPARPRRRPVPSEASQPSEASHAPTQAAREPAPLQESQATLSSVLGGALRIGRGR